MLLPIEGNADARLGRKRILIVEEALLPATLYIGRIQQFEIAEIKLIIAEHIENFAAECHVRIAMALQFKAVVNLND